MGAATMGLLPAQLLKLYRMVVKFWLPCHGQKGPCMVLVWETAASHTYHPGTFLMMAEIPTQLLMTNHV